MVAKSEVRNWPLIGWITAQAGTVYVQRADVKGGRTQTHAEVNAAMAEAFCSGLPVLFFPEGTTTDGGSVLPFRRGLFHSVVRANAMLKMVAVAYSFDRHNPEMSIARHVCYWGDMQFGSHLFRCLGVEGLHAHVGFGERELAGTDRFALSERARDEVLLLYTKIGQSCREPLKRGEAAIYPNLGSVESSRLEKPRRLESRVT